MTDCRTDYEEYLGKERLDRILSASETEADEKRAGRATLHYASWHNQRMLSCLPWSIWMYYQTVDRAENTLAALGIIGSMYGGVRAAQASFSWLKRQRELRSVAEKIIRDSHRENQGGG